MVLGAPGRMNNADLKKNRKLEHCARCVYYSSEITTHASNLKNTLLVLIGLQNNPPKRSQSALGTLF